MKNIYKMIGVIVLVAVIGFSMTACKKSNNSGLTITGLDDYNGKYVLAMSDDEELISCASITILDNGERDIKATKISGGKTMMNIFKEVDKEFIAFTNSGTFSFYVFIVDKEDDIRKLFVDEDYSLLKGSGILRNVEFSNGSGSSVFR